MAKGKKTEKAKGKNFLIKNERIIEDCCLNDFAEPI